MRAHERLELGFRHVDEGGTGEIGNARGFVHDASKITGKSAVQS